MPKLRRARALTDDERATVRRLAHSRTVAARLMERAGIIWLSTEGRHVAPLSWPLTPSEPLG